MRPRARKLHGEAAKVTRNPLSSQNDPPVAGRGDPRNAGLLRSVGNDQSLNPHPHHPDTHTDSRVVPENSETTERTKGSEGTDVRVVDGWRAETIKRLQSQRDLQSGPRRAQGCEQCPLPV